MDKRIFGLTSLIFLTAWAAPSRIQRVDFRAHFNPITVTFDKSSPAYAALEDTRQIYIEPSEERTLASIKVESLITGGKFHYPKVPPQKLVLQALEISSQTKVDHLADLIADLPVSRTQAESQRLELQASDTLTMSEYGEILVQEELSRRNGLAASPGAQRIPTQSGQVITVEKPVRVVRGPAQLPREVAPSKPMRLADLGRAKNKDTKAPTIRWPKSATPSTPANAASPARDGPTIASNNIKSSQPQNYILSGELIFGGGAAWLGGRQEIHVYQTRDALRVAEGSVNYGEARFTIGVEKLEGEIHADILSEDGQLMASGRLNLLDLHAKYINQAKIMNQLVEIKPVFAGASGQVLSSIQFGDKAFMVDGARVFVDGIEREIPLNKKSGLYQDADLVSPSNFLLSSRHPRHWPTYSYNESGREFQVRMFTQSFIEAFFNLTLDKYAARDALAKSVIWGRITMQGRAVMGAHVRIVGEPEKAPVYINGFLPDKTQTATVSKGEFAFSGVENEEKLVQVSIGPKLFWPVLVPVAHRHVSYADLEVQTPEKVSFKAFDAFSNAPLAAAVEPLGMEERLYVDESGQTEIEIQTVKGLTLIESESRPEYAVTRVAIRSAQNEVHIPFVKQEWLTKLAGPAAKETVLIGFVSGDDFDVMVGAETEAGARERIVYFNGKGEAIGETEKGRAGFVIFNLPRGIHTVTVLPEKSRSVVTSTAYVDESAAQVLNINLQN